MVVTVESEQPNVAGERSQIGLEGRQQRAANLVVRANGLRTGEAQFRTTAQRETYQGLELIHYWLRVLRDESEDTRWRLAAAEQLADRGFGKPVRTAKVTVDVNSTQTRYQLDALPAAILEQMERQLLSVAIDDEPTHLLEAPPIRQPDDDPSRFDV